MYFDGGCLSFLGPTRVLAWPEGERLTAQGAVEAGAQPLASPASPARASMSFGAPHPHNPLSAW